MTAVALAEHDEEIRTILLDGDHAVQLWPQAMILLEPAFDYQSRYLPEDVLELIESDKALLWCVMTPREILAASVTWIDEFPCERVLTIGFAGGDLHWLKSCIRYAKDYAAYAEVDAVEAHGRKGWVKGLRDEDFVQSSTTVRLEL